MIDLSKWQTEVVKLERGETQRYNHTDCKAGEDRRERLYLTRPSSTPGIVLAFCHNCQEHGVTRQDVVLYRDFATTTPAPIEEEVDFQVPVGLTMEVRLWPHRAHVWRHKKHLSATECEKAGIAYDPATHRIYLPQWDTMVSATRTEKSHLLGYQLCRIDENGPKYLTAKADQHTIVGTKMYVDMPQSPKVGYVVEDLASGIVLARGYNIAERPYAITVNYGTQIKTELLAKNNHITYGVVWLDNDNEHVVEQAATIARVWNLVTNKNTYIERLEKDPKNVEQTEMQNIIREHQRWNQST